MSAVSPALREVFDAIGRDAARRDRDRILPFAEVDALRDVGFTRLTLPREYGGRGASRSELFETLAELARSDSNLAQLFRSHFSFIDRTLLMPDGATKAERLRLVADGAIHGNATFDRGGPDAEKTTLSDTAAGPRLSGRKFYSTGTLFADLVSVLAERDGQPVSVLVPTTRAGVQRVDDWNGFGQRVTGSGTTVFTDVVVEPERVSGVREAPTDGPAFVQLVLLATLVGIGRAVVDDAVAYVTARTRTYSHASAPRAADDPLVQEVVGELSALSYRADAALALAASVLETSASSLSSDSGEADRDAAICASETHVTKAQLVTVPAVLDAASRLFEVGGASALDRDRGLDRHWRNARTLASHNPARYKARALGAHLLTGSDLVGWWTSGDA